MAVPGGENTGSILSKNRSLERPLVQMETLVARVDKGRNRGLDN